MAELRHLVLVLGDQLDAESAAFEGFDPACDAVLMIEAAGESTHVWSHKARSALFLSAMRHFAQDLRARGWTVDYRALGDDADAVLVDILAARLAQHRPRKLVLVEPGEWRLEQAIRVRCSDSGMTLDVRDDLHAVRRMGAPGAGAPCADPVTQLVGRLGHEGGGRSCGGYGPEREGGEGLAASTLCDKRDSGRDEP